MLNEYDWYLIGLVVIYTACNCYQDWANDFYVLCLDPQTFHNTNNYSLRGTNVLGV